MTCGPEMSAVEIARLLSREGVGSVVVVDADGETPRSLYALGALRKGVLWETLAVPEIRGQAHDVASRILGSPAG